MGKPGGSRAPSPIKVCHLRVSMPITKTDGRRDESGPFRIWLGQFLSMLTTGGLKLSAHLWPYAIQAANDSLNVRPCARHRFKASPLQVFSRTDVDINPTHWIPFGSPVYVLATPLQGSTRIHNKWKERARLGVYLGRSPMHAQLVALVLSLETGLVSPQFHIVFDPSFRTMHPDQSNQVPKSQWQKKCGFIGPKTRTEVQGNQIIDEPQFIGPTDVAIVPEAEGATSEPAEDVAIRYLIRPSHFRSWK
jgi:hypothetical protein